MDFGIKRIKLKGGYVMSKLPVEELLPRAGNSVYRLVRMASNRAMELAEGKPRLIKNPTIDKETTIALEEILHGKIEYKEIADLTKPIIDDSVEAEEETKEGETEESEENQDSEQE